MILTTETRTLPAWPMVIFTTDEGHTREMNLLVCSWDTNPLGHLNVQEAIAVVDGRYRLTISSYKAWTEWHVEPHPTLIEVESVVPKEEPEEHPTGTLTEVQQ